MYPTNLQYSYFLYLQTALLCLLMLLALDSMAQDSKLITGKLFDENENPIRDAQIIVLPDSVQITTDDTFL